VGKFRYEITEKPCCKLIFAGWPCRGNWHDFAMVKEVQKAVLEKLPNAPEQI
jgi:hypothetical protein